MKNIIMIATMLTTFSAFAQQWMSFDTKSLEIKQSLKGDSWRTKEIVKIFHKGKQIGDYDHMFESPEKKTLTQRLIRRLDYYQEHYPQSKLLLLINNDGSIVINRGVTVNSFLKLHSINDLSNNSMHSALEVKLIDIEAQRDELEREVIHLQSELEKANEAKEESSSLLETCLESQKRQELTYLKDKSNIDLTDDI